MRPDHSLERPAAARVASLGGGTSSILPARAYAACLRGRLSSDVLRHPKPCWPARSKLRQNIWRSQCPSQSMNLQPESAISIRLAELYDKAVHAAEMQAATSPEAGPTCGLLTQPGDRSKVQTMKTTSRTFMLGRIIMTIATLMYGVIPPFVDLTETHVFHPDWTPHARMHMVWLLGTNTSIAVLALYFLWLHQSSRPLGVRLAGVLGLCVYGGFMLSASTISIYGGSLSDRGGVPPIMGMDANIIAFSLALLLLLVGWSLARKSDALE